MSRLGIIATRRLGRATIRNRSKRLVRELFRQDKDRTGLDIVVMPRPGFSDAPFTNLQDDYRATVRRDQRTRR